METGLLELIRISKNEKNHNVWCSNTSDTDVPRSMMVGRLNDGFEGWIRRATTETETCQKELDCSSYSVSFIGSNAMRRRVLGRHRGVQ